MKWETPSYTDLRFGFEVTMYIYNRYTNSSSIIVGDGLNRRGFAESPFFLPKNRYYRIIQAFLFRLSS